VRRRHAAVQPASAVRFLSGEGGRYITGTAVTVDGGFAA